MPRPKVFSSLDYDNDSEYQDVLRAWNANLEFEFTWNETSPRVKLDSDDAAALKRALSRMIGDALYFLCIIGKYTHRSAWVQWEIEKAKELNRRLVLVKTGVENTLPSGVIGVATASATGFKKDSILRSLREARG
ncbi:MAG: TIR domain-containing protein [Nitrospirota bacterium]|nr:TIR domain-containing protein [Nitrospirota bacterium]